MEKSLRYEIRKILREINNSVYNGSVSNGFSYGDTYNHFPYADPHQVPRVPQDINPAKEYVYNWEELSTNHDIYGFPDKEFKLGMNIEKQKKESFNTLDIADIVIKNLKQDLNFYSKLMS
jgi:hypothetical protein